MQRRLILCLPGVRDAALYLRMRCAPSWSRGDWIRPAAAAARRVAADDGRCVEPGTAPDRGTAGRRVRAARSPDGWSARDVVAHIAAWRRQAADQLKHANNAEREDFDTQTFNERTFREHQDLSWTAIGRISESAYLVLRAQTERLSDEQLRQPADLSRSNWSPWQLIKVDGFDHPMAHMASLCRRLEDGAKEESIAEAVARTSREVAQLVDFA